MKKKIGYHLIRISAGLIIFIITFAILGGIALIFAGEGKVNQTGIIIIEIIVAFICLWSSLSIAYDPKSFWDTIIAD